MASPPLVSVFMPTYNHAHFIDAAVESVVAQDYRPLEIVVSDDASTDGTAERIRDLAARHEGLVVPLFTERNVGMNSNFNRALDACRGTYVAFAAGDDLYLPGKIAAQVAWLEQSPDRVLCGHDVEIFMTGDPEVVLGRYGQRFPLVAGRGAGHLLRNGILYAGISLMARRDALPPDGYDARMTMLSDWKFFVEVLAGGGEYGYLPDVLARYRRHPDSVTNDLSRSPAKVHEFLADRLRGIKEFQARWPEHAGDLDALHVQTLVECAQLLIWTGAPAEARALLSDLVRVRPSKAPVAAALALASWTPAAAQEVGRRAVRRVRGTTSA